MAVINIMKDGTFVDDMSKVTVTNEIFERIIAIAERRKEEKEMQSNGN